MRLRSGVLASLSLGFLALGCSRSSLDESESFGSSGSGGPTRTCEPGQKRSCYTGPAGTEGVGTCKAGAEVCSSTGAGWGPCEGEVLPSAQTCTGLDNECDGMVDEGCACEVGQQQACYTGPAATEGVGVCVGGMQVCSASGWGPCMGEVLPSVQTCTGLDNECDGIVDEGCACEVGQQQPCYTGPAGTEGVGVCVGGMQVCSATGWGPCMGEVLPSPQTCTGLDNECDGMVDEGCACEVGQQQPCYTGPAGTVGVGVCMGGMQTCSLAGWGACVGEVLPGPQTCTGLDNECDGMVDEGCVCEVGQQQSCYTGPAGTLGVGPCMAGTQTCSLMGWGPCVGEVVPLPNECGVVDNNCDGSTTGLTCPVGFTCGTSIALANPPEPWTFNGVAIYETGSPAGPLVGLAGEYDKAGTMIYANPIATDAFKVTFESGYMCDGVAFMLETTGPMALGGANGGFGMSGLAGYGFELDAFQNDCGGDPPAPHVGVDDLSQTCGPANSVLTSMFTAPVNDPAAMPGFVIPIEIDVNQGMVTMIVHGTTVISGFSIPDFPVGQQFYYGFGSSNGYIQDCGVTVQNVKVTFPTPRCL